MEAATDAAPSHSGTLHKHRPRARLLTPEWAPRFVSVYPPPPGSSGAGAAAGAGGRAGSLAYWRDGAAAAAGGRPDGRLSLRGVVVCLEDQDAAVARGGRPHVLALADAGGEGGGDPLLRFATADAPAAAAWAAALLGAGAAPAPGRDGAAATRAARRAGGGGSAHTAAAAQAAPPPGAARAPPRPAPPEYCSSSDTSSDREASAPLAAPAAAATSARPLSRLGSAGLRARAKAVAAAPAAAPAGTSLPPPPRPPYDDSASAPVHTAIRSSRLSVSRLLRESGWVVASPSGGAGAPAPSLRPAGRGALPPSAPTVPAPAPGIRNLLILIVALANARLVLENLVRYGLLVSPLLWVRILYPRTDLAMASAWPAMAAAFLGAWGVERWAAARVEGGGGEDTAASRAAAKKGRRKGWAAASSSSSSDPAARARAAAAASTDAAAAVGHAAAAAFALGWPCAVVWARAPALASPVPGFVIVLTAMVACMKIVSFGHACSDLRGRRRAFLAAGGLAHPAALSGDPRPRLYPACLAPRPAAYFVAAPTLCYQPTYPRTPAVRPRHALAYSLKLSAALALQAVIWEQYVGPTIRNALAPAAAFGQAAAAAAQAARPVSRAGSFLPSAAAAARAFPAVVERVLKLSLPSTYSWVVMFVALFDCYLTLLAELTRFGDRAFFGDWWNARSVGEVRERERERERGDREGGGGGGGAAPRRAARMNPALSRAFFPHLLSLSLSLFPFPLHSPTVLAHLEPARPQVLGAPRVQPGPPGGAWGRPPGRGPGRVCRLSPPARGRRRRPAPRPRLAALAGIRFLGRHAAGAAGDDDGEAGRLGGRPPGLRRQFHFLALLLWPRPADRLDWLFRAVGAGAGAGAGAAAGVEGERGAGGWVCSFAVLFSGRTKGTREGRPTLVTPCASLSLLPLSLQNKPRCRQPPPCARPLRRRSPPAAARARLAL